MDAVDQYDALIDYAEHYCGVTWERGEEPAGVKLFAEKAAEYLDSVATTTGVGIQAKRLGDYQITYTDSSGSGGRTIAFPSHILGLLAPYKLVKFV